MNKLKSAEMMQVQGRELKQDLFEGQNREARRGESLILFSYKAKTREQNLTRDAIFVFGVNGLLWFGSTGVTCESGARSGDKPIICFLKWTSVIFANFVPYQRHPLFYTSLLDGSPLGISQGG